MTHNHRFSIKLFQSNSNRFFFNQIQIKFSQIHPQRMKQFCFLLMIRTFYKNKAHSALSCVATFYCTYFLKRNQTVTFSRISSGKIGFLRWEDSCETCIKTGKRQRTHHKTEKKNLTKTQTFAPDHKISIMI